MSHNTSSADNQQETPQFIVGGGSSETIRQTPLLKAYILGALHDGTFSSNKRFRISQKGTEWLILLKNLFKILGYNSWIYKEGKNRNVFVLETLADFLDFNFNPLKLKSADEKVCYLRGFFDAEGGVPHDKSSRFYIQLTQNDKSKLVKLKMILANLRIKTGKIHNPSKEIDPYYWRMYILSECHKDFIRKIGSWHPIKKLFIKDRG